MIYLDNAATTKMSDAVFYSMFPYLTDYYGNPSANYELGDRSRKAIEKARRVIATSINAYEDEIFFTSGGTEADNTAIKQLSGEYGIVTTTIEHKAILNSIPKHDAWCDYINVNKNGEIILRDLDEIPLYNKLVSVMYANNETGVIQPIAKVGEYIRSFIDLNDTILHTDAVQAYCHVPIDVKAEHIDALSASAHKFHGPKGVGFIYISRNLSEWRKKNIKPFMNGGGQEMGFRSGTENVAGIVGMAKAVEMAMNNLDDNIEYVTRLRNDFENAVLKTISGVTVNGSNRLPGHCSLTIEGIRGEEALEMLNGYGICASTGSACSANDSKPSHVLMAMGRTEEEANSTLRFTIDHTNSAEELDSVVEKLKIITTVLRK